LNQPPIIRRLGPLTSEERQAMPNSQPPPYLQDALARFRAAADAAVEHGRRAAADARESGAAFDRETAQLVEKLRRGEREPRGARRTSPDLRAAATEFRESQGMPIPDVSAKPPAAAQSGDDDEYFSQQRIMRKV
jgi:hypothetical protein